MKTIFTLITILLFHTITTAQISLFPGGFGATPQPGKEEDKDIRKSVAFADFLYNSGDFEYASKEYLKLYFTNRSDSLALRVATAAKASKNVTLAEEFYEKLYSKGVLNEVDRENLISIYKNKGAYKKALEVSKTLTRSREWNCSKFFFLMGEKDSATLYLSKVDTNSFTNTNSVLQLLEEKPKEKNHAVSLLASILPGGGYIYTERYGDAMFANMIIIPLAVVSAIYYTHDEEVKAYVWGGIGGAFYIGSIFGGVRSVSLYNKKSVEHNNWKIKELYSEGQESWFLE